MAPPPTRLRPYDHAADFEAVCEFLVRTFGAENPHRNWLQPRWEYMHFHPYVRRVERATIGVWEVDGEIVGVVHPELSMGQAYLELDPGRRDLIRPMLAHAERSLSVAADGAWHLQVFANADDRDLGVLLEQRGYAPTATCEPMSRLDAQPVGSPSLPPGYRLQSLAEDDDLARSSRALWRGFGHPGEPPVDSVADRAFMQSAPGFRRELNLVVVAPDGAFVAYAGLWLEPVHRIAYVEPVATDPDHRRLGLGRAAVLEGARRCFAEGAPAAYVGTDMPFYRSLGFRRVYNRRAWERTWADRRVTRPDEP